MIFIRGVSNKVLSFISNVKISLLSLQQLLLWRRSFDYN
jgi:hypothetical protein